MTPRHFEMIAKAMADSRPDHITDADDHRVVYNRWLSTIHSLANVLAYDRGTNSFDRSKFIDQCKFGA